MEIEYVTKKLMDKAIESYKKYGFLQPITMFLTKDPLMLSILPVELIEMFSRDKERYVEIVRDMVREQNPEAVFLICEAWFLDNIKNGRIEQPSKSPDRKECAFLTIDTKERQVTYINEIKEKQMSEWRVFGVSDKLNHSAGNIQTMAGNFTDFYSTGSVLNVPVEVLQKPKGEVNDVPKIDI